MTEPQNRSEMRELLTRHGVAPRKPLGQHFLADPNIVRRIVRLSGVTVGSQVLEVGAGTGTLTRALAATGARVIAYEVDESLSPLLDETVGELPNVEVRIDDAANLDAGELTGEWTLVANLPYNVGTPILLDLLRTAPAIRHFVVMVQREMADRLTAEPGSKTYGLPTVVIDLFAKARFAFSVPPQVFVPPPQVSSAVVEISRQDTVPEEAALALELASAGFSQRRKMLRSSLRSVSEDPSQLCSEAGVDPSRRAESLTSAEWLALARAAK